MNKTILVLMLCIAAVTKANDTTVIKIIPLDSLKKYHIGIAKIDSNKIQLAKTDFVPWSKMSVVEKGEYIVKTIINEYRVKYPILFWLMVAIVTIWIFKQALKIIDKIKK
jgi:wyosine [tRNA(Phe)-imidazoG37] synthetase (radical SAM superfamily)